MKPESKLVSLSFYWEGESIVVWEFRPIALVPVKQSSLSGFSGEVWSPLRRAGLKKKPLISVYSSLPQLGLEEPLKSSRPLCVVLCCIVFDQKKFSQKKSQKEIQWEVDRGGASTVTKKPSLSALQFPWESPGGPQGTLHSKVLKQ